MRLGLVAAIAVFGVVGSSALAAGTVRSNWDCADVLAEAYNRDVIEVAGQLFSLRSCQGGERVMLASRDSARCVEVNRCARATEPRRDTTPPPASGNGSYEDSSGPWNCASPEGCGCNRGGCEFRDYNNNNYNGGNGDGGGGA